MKLLENCGVEGCYIRDLYNENGLDVKIWPLGFQSHSILKWDLYINSPHKKKRWHARKRLVCLAHHEVLVEMIAEEMAADVKNMEMTDKFYTQGHEDLA